MALKHTHPADYHPTDYLVLGRDAAGVGEELDRRATIHWDYMDRFASQLIARGPLLSPDGEEHTGSIHIIRSASALEAQRFAREEPYCRAGLYSSVTVTPFRGLLSQTMLERAPASLPEYSTFMRAGWPACSCHAKQMERLQWEASRNEHWVFVGLLQSDDMGFAGLAAAADLKPEAAERALRELLDLSEFCVDQLELSRWQRGGRPKMRQ